MISRFIKSIQQRLSGRPRTLTTIRTEDCGIAAYYKLAADGRTPVPCSPEAYDAWFPTSGPERIVRKTEIGKHRVSTVFTATVYDLDDHGPFLYETMIMDGPFEGYVCRSRTWDASEIVHEQFCSQLRAGTFDEWARNNPQVKI